MKRRLVAAAAALLLATIGGLSVIRYVAAADQRALSGLDTVDVLVVTDRIPQGTPAEEMTSRLVLKSLPGISVTAGSVSRLDQIGGQVASVDLEPGEQLLLSRFIDPGSLLGPNEVAVPEGLLQTSVLLDKHRVVGGTVEAGATIAVHLSYKDPDTTHLAIHQILVTKVQHGVLPGGDSGANTAPEGFELVTFATKADDAEKIVFAAEHGSIWLSAEPESADQSGTQVLTKGNLFP